MLTGRRNGGRPFHVFAIEADAAGTGLFEAGDEAEEGGLAAAGRAEEGEEFVGVDIQGHIVKGLQALAGVPNSMQIRSMAIALVMLNSMQSSSCYC